MDKVKNVIVYPICGFANRLRFISTCYSICQKYDCNMQIYWKPSDECNLGFNEIFESIGSILEIKEMPQNYVFLGHKHLHHIINLVTNHVRLEGDIDNLILMGSHEYNIPQLNKLEFLKYKYQLYKSIRWNSNILNIVDKSIADNNLNNYVSVHYRGLDNRFDANDLKNNRNIDFENNSTIAEFNNIINLIKNDYKVILFSNKKDVNINRAIRINNSDCNRKNNQDMINSIVEFIIMSRSKLIIGTYFSSFSDEATFFNLIPKIIPYSVDDTILPHSYHCSGFSFENGFKCINYNNKSILDCLNI